MSLVLNTNINSLVAQNSLTSSSNQLSTALQQLSSGLRINTAADDAAGYAIVQGMTSQIGGLNQASQNASNGVSLAQTAQGALTEITNDLQTMRDLAVESLNATNNGQDRANLNQEFQQLSADVDNVAKTTSFNGVNLLDGTFAGATFQIGANAGQTIQVAAVASARASALGQTYSATVNKGPATAALTAGEVVINGDSVGATASDGVSFANGTFSAIAVANAINSANISGVTATANATAVTGAAAPGAGPYTLVAGDLVVNGINIRHHRSDQRADRPYRCDGGGQRRR
jgi:flagellin